MKKIFVFASAILAMLTLSGCTTSSLKQNAMTNDSSSSFVKKASPVPNNKPAVDDVTQISRYTTVGNGPTQSEVNPLMAISTFKFPPSVYTVGQAVNQVLATTGYELSPYLSSLAKKTLRKPLPITNRKLGPMTIQSALEVLMGQEVYTLERDPLNRVINFKLKPTAALLGVESDG